MSGHSKWATIKRKKAATDAKRGKVFTKLIKELMIAARDGGDIETNPRLRQAVSTAKTANMPNDNIKRAIQKGTGELEGVSYEEFTYEGYGPGGVALFMEVLTDNKQRTVADIRHAMNKHGGNLGENGSVAWMFEKLGQITISENGHDEDLVFEEALEAGAEQIILAGAFGGRSDHVLAHLAQALDMARRGVNILATSGLEEAWPLLPGETRHRVLIHALRWVASAPYAPRRATLARLETAIRAGRTLTLHGCLIGAANGRCVVAREPAAVQGLSARVGETWDNRWIVRGPDAGVEVRALGENGLKSCPDWRSSGLARVVLLASPAVWRNDDLVAAPLAKPENAWSAELVHPANHFLSSLLSH